MTAVGTLSVAVPLLWPGRETWSTVPFAIALGLVAILAAAKAAKVCPPGDIAAGAKTAVVLSLLIVVPILFDPRSLDRVNLPKLTAALIGALAIIAIWAVEAVRWGPGPRWRNGLHWPALALVGWTAVTSATSVSPRLSILGDFNTDNGLLATVAFAVIFFAVIQTINMDGVKAVLSVLYFGAGGLTVLYGLMQLHDRLISGSRWDWVRPFSETLYSSFGNPNHLAAFLSILVPVGCVLFMLHTSRQARIVIWLIMEAALVELFYTASRGALLATVLSVVAAAALLWPEIRRRPKVSVRVAVAATASVVAAFLAVAAMPGSDAKLSSGARLSGTMRLRMDLWTLGVATTNARPLVGHGPDTWIDRAPRYQNAETARRYGPEGYYSNGAHNRFVDQMAATGYPGLVLLLSLLGLAAVRAAGAWRRFRKIESEARTDDVSRAYQARLCLVAVVSGLVAYLVQGSFNINQIGLSFIFWFFLGLLGALSLGAGVPISLRPRELVGDPAAPARLETVGVADGYTKGRLGERPPTRGNRVVTAAVGVLALTGLALAISVANRPLRASHNAWAASVDQVTAARSEAGERARLSGRAATHIVKAIRLNPWDASHLVTRVNMLLGEASTRSSSAATSLRSARELSERAIDLRPYNSIYLERHAINLLKIHTIDPGNAEARAEALDAFRRAVRANPYSARLQSGLQSLETRPSR